MYCANCGAELKGQELRCPYCGDINLAAAEKEYMDQLDDILDDTKALSKESINEYKCEFTSRAKTAIKVFAILSLLVVLLMFAFMFCRFSIYLF